MDKIEGILTRGVEKIYPSKEALEKVLKSAKKLKVYNGIDPTSPNIHLGNAIPIRKLRQFQDLGHKIILLVGDFTARIGDPSDKTAMRPQLSREEVLRNVKTYKEQAAKILDFDSKDNPCEIKFNSQWLEKLTNKEVIELAACFTVQQMIERDLFQERLKEEKPIGLHEFLYPLYQGYDSVAMDIDVEVGGREQTFNMLVGRSLIKIYKNKEKFALTNPWLSGTDGRKMSKSWGNVINLTDKPQEMYGKLMSLHDDLIIQYFDLCTDISEEKINKMTQQLSSGVANPMDLKKKLAHTIVTMYHSEIKAKEAEKEFERVFQKGEAPLYDILISDIKPGEWNIIDLLMETKLAPSRSWAKRLVEQGGVDVNNKPITNYQLPITLKEGTIIRAGKRKFVKISKMKK